MNVDIYEYSSYQQLLKDELSSRIKTNSQYSTRAFARDLDLSISMLSQILNFKKQLSATTANSIAKIEDLNEHDTQYFVSLVRSQSEPNTSVKLDSISYIFKHGKFLKRQTLPENQLAYLDHWYSSLIYTSLEVDRFQRFPEEIAKSLNIELSEVLKTLSNLLEAKLIDYSDGKYVKTKNGAEILSDIPSQAIKAFHLNQITKAQEMLLNEELEKRHFLHLSFTYDNKYKKEITDKMQSFIDEINKYDELGVPNSLASFNINSLFFEPDQEDDYTSQK